MTTRKTWVKWMVIFALPLWLMASCSKTDFLAVKSNTNIITPQSLEDFQKLLDGSHMNSMCAGLPEMAADDYKVDAHDWQSAAPVQRNSYVWAADIYEGTPDIRDWHFPYQAIFYTNNVLSELDGHKDGRTAAAGKIRGQALFKRAFAYYDLARNFCKPYDASTAGSDLGLPLRLEPAVDYVARRSNLAETYERIFADLREAAALLSIERPVTNFFRPWRGAVFALLARINLDIRQYGAAERYADSCLTLYNKLIDYNALISSASAPFSNTNAELIYSAMTVGSYNFTAGSRGSPARIAEELIGMYEAGDLRFSLFFTEDLDGKHWKKRGYGGQAYPFTGLATDEIYLVKAECLARRNEVPEAMEVLNTLRRCRFENTKPFEQIIAEDAEEALQHVLDERRRELVWRCLRWQDIKRLNLEGAEISLVRVLDDEEYILPPNSSRYAFPIPDDEIAQSGIIQNIR